MTAFDTKSNQLHTISHTAITETEDDDPPIYMLNDDCIIYICKYLDIYDLLALNKVSQRFYNIAFHAFKRSSISLMLRTIKLDELDEVFEKIVIPNTKSLFMSGGACIESSLQHRLLKNIPKCQKLDKLNLMYFRLDFNTIQSFEGIFANLHTLHLNRCDMADDFILYLIPLKHLKILDLAGNIILLGLYLYELKSKIEEFYLDFCTRLDYFYFKKYLDAHPNELRILNISFDNNLYDDKLLNILVESQPNLEILKIGELKIPDYMPLVKLKKLKSLTCHQISTFTLKPNMDDIVIGLSETHLHLVELDISFCVLNRGGQNALKKFDNLKVLRIKRLQIGNGNFEFIKNLASLKNLKELDISYCKLTDEDCLEIISKAPKLEVGVLFFKIFEKEFL